MGGHIHIGPWFVIGVALAMAMVNTVARIIAGHLHDTPIGRALAFAF